MNFGIELEDKAMRYIDRCIGDLNTSCILTDNTEGEINDLCVSGYLVNLSVKSAISAVLCYENIKRPLIARLDTYMKLIPEDCKYIFSSIENYFDKLGKFTSMHRKIKDYDEELSAIFIVQLNLRTIVEDIKNIYSDTSTKDTFDPVKELEDLFRNSNKNGG